MQKLRVIGLFGCLIINNYAIEESRPPTYLFEEPKSPDLTALQSLSNLPIGYTQDGFPVYDFLGKDHFGQIFFPSSLEIAGDSPLSHRKDDLQLPSAESPDWLALASVFFEEGTLFTEEHSNQKVLPDDSSGTTVSETQSPPAQSRFADFFRQNNQQPPFQTIQTAAALLPGLNPQAQEFKPNGKKGGDKRPLGDQQREQVDLCSTQQKPGPLYERRRVNIEPLVLQHPLLPGTIAQMENMKDLYYYEKTFFNGGRIDCCRSACTQGGRFYSGHALIGHFPGLTSYLQRNGLPIN